MPQLWVQSRLAPNFVLLPSPYYPNMSHPDATLQFRNLIQDPIPSMVPMTRLAPIPRRTCRYHPMPMHIPRTQLAPTFPRVPVIPPRPQPCPRPETLRTRLICAAHCHSALTHSKASPCRTTRGFYLGRQPPTFVLYVSTWYQSIGLKSVGSPGYLICYRTASSGTSGIDIHDEDLTTPRAKGLANSFV